MGASNDSPTAPGGGDAFGVPPVLGGGERLWDSDAHVLGLLPSTLYHKQPSYYTGIVTRHYKEKKEGEEEGNKRRKKRRRRRKGWKEGEEQKENKKKKRVKNEVAEEGEGIVQRQEGKKTEEENVAATARASRFSDVLLFLCALLTT
ncbi:hypothetical protein M9H77_25549 [Catharanthus roseus]|uniref:Uncharacterized protein n=1 Tax=Catharanthus roseus TaxID=4058 RepID=A0ACC0A7K7_CATRO|nr:hypothetical protein M9H77_25549 [Catharanthus roseus]